MLKLNFKFNIKSFVIGLIIFCTRAFGFDSIEPFTKSFIYSYDLSGKYTHEYHPFILEKTRQSFLELEQSVKNAGISIDGHICIFGYQEEAIPPYQTDWSRAMLKDDAATISDQGLVGAIKNIFGFMTGFLLKDAQWLENYWFKGKHSSVKHISANDMSLFNDESYIFQKHAFGKDFTNLLRYRKQIEAALHKKSLRDVLAALVDVWSHMYKSATTTGSEEIVGTQDINFSIDYAKALIKSSSALDKFFLGPDITYPIEVLSCQNENTTRNAQKFLEEFQSELVAKDNRKTAYIFCSFVDGVGKSTLLNNIKNFQNFKRNYKDYKRGDNSSSQLADLYELKDKVYLVDLPAQMSHFVIKPDGYVFVDINTVNLAQGQKNQIQSIITSDKVDLVDQFSKLLTLTKSQKSINKPLYDNKSTYVEQYARNCVALEINNPWIPGVFEDIVFIFDKNNPESIRILTPLSQAHSYGLKSDNPEQMLFTDGLSLPMQYDKFLEDLKTKLTQAGIEHVVFTNFLSMYPRTSRETVRINFLLQYLKQIFGKEYDFYSSVFQNFVYREQEICRLLKNQQNDLSNTVVLETALRWALYDILETHLKNDVSFLAGQQLESSLKNKINFYFDKIKKDLYSLIHSRFNPERDAYYQKYEFNRIYQSVVMSSSESIVKFSQLITKLFQSLNNPIWEDILVDARYLSGADNKEQNLLLKGKVFERTREIEKIKAFSRIMRAQWTAILSGLLPGEKAMVPPLIANLDNSENINMLSLYQKKLPIVDKLEYVNYELKVPTFYHIGTSNPLAKVNWGRFGEEKKLYFMDWQMNFGTYFGVYGYGYFPLENADKLKWPKSNIINGLVAEYQLRNIFKEKPDRLISTTQLYEQIQAKQLESKIKEEIKKQVSNNMQIIEKNDQRIAEIQLWAQMIASLESVVKDPESDIVIRHNNQQDYIASIKLLELVTLPLYYNIELKEPLFDDYSVLEPLVR